MPVDRSSRVRALYQTFRSRFRRNPVVIAIGPGRVNLIGEHTDYNEGFVLPAAIDRSTLVAAAPASGRESRVWSANLGEEGHFQAGESHRSEDKSWVNYLAGCAWALTRSGLRVVQADLVVESDVPLGAGLSSSAALEVSTVAALAGIADHGLKPAEIARIAHRAEAEFVGVPCGIMDQVASALGADDSALLIDCRTEEVEPVGLGLEAQGLALAIVESGVSRRLSGSAYSERREECREACRFLRGPLGRPVGSLREVTLEDLALVGDQLPRALLRRARHVVSENRRVLDFVAALRDQDLDEAGALMARSHRSLREDFEVSTPELDLLVELAAKSHGTLGARLTGAGFGGCTVNLVHTDTLGDFRDAVVEEYIRRTGRKARVHVCRPVTGVLVERP